MAEESSKETNIIGQITDLFGAGTATNRFLTMVERGIGPMLRPIADRWANRHHRIDTKKHFEMLKAEGLEVRSVELELDGRASLRASFEQRQIQENREAITLIAMEEAALAADVPRGVSPVRELPPIEMEWIDHFWDLAGRVSSEDRQVIWGRILARTAHGSPTSARTLMLLSTLSGEEARQLERLARFVVRTYITDHRPCGLLHNLPTRPGKNSDLIESYSNELRKISGPFNQALFGSIGIFVEDGWAFPFHVPTDNAVAYLDIAGEPYEIGPLENTLGDWNYADIGSGVQISPMGEEIFALIDAEPHGEWVNLLTEAYQANGWELRRKD